MWGYRGIRGGGELLMYSNVLRPSLQLFNLARKLLQFRYFRRDAEKAFTILHLNVMHGKEPKRFTVSVLLLPKRRRTPPQKGFGCQTFPPCAAIFE